MDKKRKVCQMPNGAKMVMVAKWRPYGVHMDVKWPEVSKWIKGIQKGGKMAGKWLKY